MLIRQASRHSENEDESPLAMQHRLLEEKKQAESLKNPTQAMVAIQKRMEERERERQGMSWQQQLQHLTVSSFLNRIKIIRIYFCKFSQMAFFFDSTVPIKLYGT